MAATKRLVVLDPNYRRIAQIWHQFVGERDRLDADKVMIRKLSRERFTVLNDRECSILLRWWNYLPSNLIDSSDRNLYDAIREFLYP